MTLTRRTYLMLTAALFGASLLAAPVFAQSEPLPTEVSKGTVLRIGDPQTQAALELSGLINELPFTAKWANIAGGPLTIEAFRANALDVGAVADIPPLFATWTGLDVKIIAAQFRHDPVNHPIYRFGIAPKAAIKTLEDFRGKRIAFSPGQAQGALVLRALKAAGLQKSDVTLVELPSKGNEYPTALAGGQVDVAPLGNVLIKHYENQYGRDGAITISHGLRDDPGHLYAPKSVLDDPAKAAALAAYVKYWALANQWIYDNPEKFKKGYLVATQGLNDEDAQYIIDSAGQPEFPARWDDVIVRHQATADLLAAELGKPPIDTNTLYDRRFETIAADALAKN